MNQLNLVAHAHASGRTKQRISQHGPIFVERRQDYVPCMDDRWCILVESASNGWFGWLPMSELTTFPVADEV